MHDSDTTGTVTPPAFAPPTSTEPAAGAPAVILDYGRASRGERFWARVRPERLTLVVGGVTLLWAASIGRTPAWVAVTAAAGLSLMWWVYARERSTRQRGAYWLVTDQLLLAIVVSAEGVYETLYRARHISQPGVWLPYNQTFYLDPSWALEPLRHTAVGIGWFITVWAVIWLRRRFRRVTSSPAPAQLT